MKQLLIVSAALLALSACGKEESAPTAATPSTAAGPRPEKMPNGEPTAITLQHILIAFEGSERSQQKRTKAEAEKLAYEILGRAKSGENFEQLMKQYSNDPGGGTYGMVNHGVTPSGPDEYPRTGMVPAFGDVGFRISVNEVGLAEHDPKTSPFGYHVIKRIK